MPLEGLRRSRSAFRSWRRNGQIGFAGRSNIEAYRGRPGWSVERVAGSRVVARLVAAAQPWLFSERLAQRIQNVLAGLDVESWAVQPLRSRITLWSVREDDFVRAVEAVRAELAGQGFYLRPLGGRRIFLAEEALPDGIDSVRGVDIFRYLRDSTGRVTSDYERCLLVRWTRSERDTLTTEVREAVVQEIEDQSPVPVVEVRRWDGSTQPRPAVLAVPDAAEIDFEVDAVYMWVSGADPAWQERQQAAFRKLHLQDPTIDEAAQSAVRYRDRGELRASMRSLEMYAPWIRRIFLVTDDQHPDWLDLSSDRVTVVDHRQIFSDPSVLPCFNSRAIGSQLHRIPGLAEHYLVVNDDVMFNRAVSPYDFFTPEGFMKIVLSRSRLARLDPEKLTALERSRTNSAGLIKATHGATPTRVFAHIPLTQSKQIAEEISQLYAAEVTQTMQHQFRSPFDYETNAWLHQYRAMFTHRAIVTQTPYVYTSPTEGKPRELMDSGEAFADALFVCLNDNVAPDEKADDAWLASWLSRFYPVAASFELAEDTTGDSSLRLGQ